MATTTKVWSDDELVSLMAWLDFCRDRGINFDDTIESHLSKAKKGNPPREIPFTKMQIKNKFAGYLRLINKPATHAIIQEKGSDYFDNLSEEIRHRIKSEVRRYKATGVRLPPESNNTYHPPAPISTSLDELPRNDSHAQGIGKEAKDYEMVLGSPHT